MGVEKSMSRTGVGVEGREEGVEMRVRESRMNVWGVGRDGDGNDEDDDDERMGEGEPRMKEEKVGRGEKRVRS